jgi:hypothetical protein
MVNIQINDFKLISIFFFLSYCYHIFSTKLFYDIFKLHQYNQT